MHGFIVSKALLISLVIVGCSSGRPGRGKGDHQLSNEFFEVLLNCGKQENYQVAEFQKLAANRFENATENAKCFTKCVFEKFEVLKDGEFDEVKQVEVVKSFSQDKQGGIGEKVILKIGKACKYEDKEERQRRESEGLAPLNDCERAYNIVRCEMEFIPEQKQGRH